jgi:hypothetical protein
MLLQCKYRVDVSISLCKYIVDVYISLSLFSIRELQVDMLSSNAVQVWIYMSPYTVYYPQTASRYTKIIPATIHMHC